MKNGMGCCRPPEDPKALAVTVGGFGFLHAAQVIQGTRKTRDLGARRWRTMTGPSGSSAERGRPTWLLRYVTTAAIPPDPSRPSGSPEG